MKKSPTEVGASVRARLLGLAHEQGEDFQLLLTRYANERLLFRLSASGHAQQFVLKGAALFALWTGKPHRATRDLDLLGFGDPGVAHVREVFTKVLAHDAVDDGVQFDLATLEVGLIREDQEYGGVRVEVVARVTNARVRLQVDVGFGDVVTPEAMLVEIPPLLDFPAPRLRAYPRETTVREIRRNAGGARSDHPSPGPSSGRIARRSVCRARWAAIPPPARRLRADANGSGAPYPSGCHRPSCTR